MKKTIAIVASLSVIILLMIIARIFIPKDENHDGFKPLNQFQIKQYAKDPQRYIAHAGGQIDGFNYTNTLEALNVNYAKGFKKFELDIISTSDDFFVAAHDWKKWKRISNFEGEVPPTREEFLKQKIHKKYTAIDIEGINEWFKNHPDAILVTDKVNDVSTFSNQFIDKNRLMMELFNWESVAEAKTAGIKSALPTGNLLINYSGDIIKLLQENQVEEVALSRKFIETEKQLLDDLKLAGIRIYAFHVNANQGKGTNYMICNESHYFFGIYADNWQKDWQPNCQ